MKYLINLHFSNILFFILTIILFQNIYNEIIDENAEIKGKYPEFIYKLKNNKFKKLIKIIKFISIPILLIK